MVSGQWIGSMVTEWERLKILFKKLEIPRELIVQNFFITCKLEYEIIPEAS